MYLSLRIPISAGFPVIRRCFCSIFFWAGEVHLVPQSPQLETSNPTVEAYRSVQFFGPKSCHCHQNCPHRDDWKVREMKANCTFLTRATWIYNMWWACSAQGWANAVHVGRGLYLAKRFSCQNPFLYISIMFRTCWDLSFWRSFDSSSCNHLEEYAANLKNGSARI